MTLVSYLVGELRREVLGTSLARTSSAIKTQLFFIFNELNYLLTYMSTLSRVKPGISNASANASTFSFNAKTSLLPSIPFFQSTNFLPCVSCTFKPIFSGFVQEHGDLLKIFLH